MRTSISLSIATILVSTACFAQEAQKKPAGGDSYPIQVSLIPDAALKGSDVAINGLAINLVYGDSPSVSGLAIGIINQVRGELHGLQIGVINIATEKDNLPFMPIVNAAW
jgi:hypothetical protein